MAITLVVLSGPLVGERLEIDGECTLGREGAEYDLADPEASRRHLRLRVLEHGLEVEDLGSLNGTLVDGEPIAAPTLVGHGAELQVGTTKMTVELPPPPDDATRVARPIPDPQATVFRPRPELQPTVIHGTGPVPDPEGLATPEPPPAGVTPDPAPGAEAPAAADSPKPDRPRPFFARLFDRLLRRRRDS